MRGGSVAVVGGSIAGCAFARAAARGGAERVTVLERSPGRLEDRGVGLCVVLDRYAELVRAGHLDDGIRHHPLTERHWVAADPGGAHGPRGRVLWVQPMTMNSFHWGVLWQGLRERAPDGVEFRAGTTVTAVGGGGTADGDRGNGNGSDDVGSGGGRDDRQAWVETADGREPYDLVVGADGHRSVVRAAVCPDARPEYAGYVCWRGSFDARLLDRLPGGGARWPAHEVITACYPGGQVVLYRIPGLTPGTTLVNWVFYASAPAWLRPVDDTSADPDGIPAGSLDPARLDELAELADRHLPPYWAEVVNLTPVGRILLQPIHDLATPRRTAGRLLLAGDAATLVRPHNTSGAAKALQDACAFEAAWRTADGWDDLLPGYDRERGAVGRALVDLGRRLGRAQVTGAPDWTAIDEAGMADWWREQLAGTGGFGGLSLDRPPNSTPPGAR
ncbi:FAD binding domain-containing protein [Kitasatospora sp. NBC_00458]|uniref:FAD binding domain-containing protein n=1 Tax=Kitasatospora sp. NBC_00458 TaxID=2903568 RepID=UPI002E17B40C